MKSAGICTGMAGTIVGVCSMGSGYARAAIIIFDLELTELTKIQYSKHILTTQ